MTSLVLYSLLTTAMYYLGSEAMITQFLWSRYPGVGDPVSGKADTGFAAFMACPACVGFWWGLICGLVGYRHEIPFLGLYGRHWLTVLFVALGALVWTPLVAHLHRRSLGG